MTPTQVAKAYINLLGKKRIGTSWKALDVIMKGNTLTTTQKAYVYNTVRCKI